ncbi:MAG: succinate-semialdehyde dehydrogenase [Acidobacteria bacterium CG_4_9_14_3_um_filter_49_7]|nr:MAG: succinate-semialdehyde dehydrogenase [Acidobacteria bacterium CG_4_9_14_3_um_filter_49_7]
MSPTPKQTACINPATGEMLGESPVHTVEDIKAAVTSARSAQPEWAALSVKERVRHIRQIQNYLVTHADELAEIIAKDNGKTVVDALAAEIMATAIAVHYYCRKAPAFLKPERSGFGTIALINKRSRVVRVPYGVIAIISPWNYPFSIPFSEVIMGLLAGNAVLLKVATETQFTGLALKSVIESANLPDGVFHYLNLPGRVAGEGFLKNGVDKLFFTGSVPVGKRLMAMAAETLTPLNLELGGNDAMLVCEDADPVRAAAGAVWAGFSNAGQSCGGVERVYVHEAIYNAFMAELKQRTEGIRPGNNLSPDCDLGCMTTAAQVEVVKAHIDDALAHGATIFAKSPEPPEGTLKQFHPAVVLTNVTPDMKVMRDETFGPVIGVMKISSMEGAVQMANDSNLGLTGSVWSRNRKKARKLASQIQAGVVTINDHLMSHALPETSWGGFKESGIGRSHGELGFNEMTQPQTIVDDLLTMAKKNLWWQPNSRKVFDGLKGLTVGLYGKGVGNRLSGMMKALKALPLMFRK